MAGSMKAALAMVEWHTHQLVRFALDAGVPKHRLLEWVSEKYDLDRNNARSPQ